MFAKLLDLDAGFAFEDPDQPGDVVRAQAEGLAFAEDLRRDAPQEGADAELGAQTVDEPEVFRGSR